MIKHYSELQRILSNNKKPNKPNQEFLKLLKNKDNKSIRKNKPNKEFLTLLKDI